MDILISILLAILLALLIGFVIYLFFAIRNVTGSIKTIENESIKISQDLRSLLVSTEELTKSLTGVTLQIDEQVKNIDWVITSIKNATSEFVAIKNKVVNVVEEPVESLTRNLSAFKKGLHVFWQKLVNR